MDMTQKIKWLPDAHYKHMTTSRQVTYITRNFVICSWNICKSSRMIDLHYSFINVGQLHRTCMVVVTLRASTTSKVHNELMMPSDHIILWETYKNGSIEHGAIHRKITFKLKPYLPFEQLYKGPGQPFKVYAAYGANTGPYEARPSFSTVTGFSSNHSPTN